MVGRHNPRLRKSCVIMIKLITGDHNLNSGRRQYAENCRTCQLCNSNEQETIEHFLFECTRQKDLRETLWGNVISSMPTPMAEHINNIPIPDKTLFILSGMYSKYIEEWDGIYVSMLKFVSQLYKSAARMRPSTV